MRRKRKKTGDRLHSMYVCTYKRVEEEKGQAEFKKKRMCIFLYDSSSFSLLRVLLGQQEDPPNIKNWPGKPIWHYAARIYTSRSPSKKKRDKGYVLEQLSAAKDESLFSIFIFHPSFLSFFPGGLYIIYPAQYKNEREKKVSFQ